MVEGPEGHSKKDMPENKGGDLKQLPPASGGVAGTLQGWPFKALALVKLCQGLLLVVPHLQEPFGHLLLALWDVLDWIALAIEVNFSREVAFH